MAKVTKVQVYLDRASKPRWRAKARNGVIIASSGQHFATPYSARRSAARAYPDAKLEDQTPLGALDND